MPRKLTTTAAVLALVLVACVPALAQLDTSVDPPEIDFDNRPAFFCGYITGNPSDSCVMDENGIAHAPDGTTFTVENGVATLSDGREILIDRPTDAGLLQYQPAPELCAAPVRFGAPPPLVEEYAPCEQSIQPYPLP